MIPCAEPRRKAHQSGNDSGRLGNRQNGGGRREGVWAGVEQAGRGDRQEVVRTHEAITVHVALVPSTETAGVERAGGTDRQEIVRRHGSIAIDVADRGGLPS